MTESRRPALLVAESCDFPDEARRLLEEVAEVQLADLDRRGLLEAVQGMDALWVRLRHRIDEEVFAAAQRLRIVVSPTTGLNHIDLQAAKERGIDVVSLRGETEFLRKIRATAELTISLTLALLRRLPEAYADTLRGGWQRDLFRGYELSDKTVGIVGYGRIGRMVAECLIPFGTTVVAFDPYITQRSPQTIRFVSSLAELVAQVDIVTLHANYSPSNHAFFGAEAFGHMKRGSWFINTARGELIDERALLEAIRSGHLAGAAVDVLTNEQTVTLANHPVILYAREHPNLIVTPHLGGSTFESLKRVESFLAKKVRNALCVR